VNDQQWYKRCSCPCLQYADAASAAGRPWPSDAIAALVRGGLGSLRLGRAESAAQAAAPGTTTGNEQPDPGLPDIAQHYGAQILAGVAWCLKGHVPRALARQGLVSPLLEVGVHVRRRIILTSVQCLCEYNSFTPWLLWQVCCSFLKLLHSKLHAAEALVTPMHHRLQVPRTAKSI
jgi:hypothetical protein